MTTARALVVAIGVCMLVTSGVLAEQPVPEAPLNPYVPPACTGIFTDVACPGGFAVNWIERFYNDGITAGCNAAPLEYCPDNPVTRAQMAVFVEKAVRGTGTWSPGDLGNSNTGLGAGALLNNSPYAENDTAVGYQALYTQSFTNGNSPYDSYNTAIGSFSLNLNQPDGGNGGTGGTGGTTVCTLVFETGFTVGGFTSCATVVSVLVKPPGAAPKLPFSAPCTT